MEHQEVLDQAWNQSLDKLSRTSYRIGESFPHITVDGRYDDNSIEWWTNGFWPGILWILAKYTGETRYSSLAERCEGMLDRAFDDFMKLHHDVGFMWLLSAVADYRITGRQDARRRGFHAATILASRFNAKGGFIRAWNRDQTGWSIIDSMMNIPLLSWASEQTHDPRFAHIAEIHADTTLKDFFRKDGSVHHIVEFDPQSGAVVKVHGGQGYGVGSSWSRGQAWALYGFTRAYAKLRHRRYLDAAKTVGSFFLAHLPEDGVPPSDFAAPPEGLALKDSSAGAIAASALLELAEECAGAEQALFRDGALNLLTSLWLRCRPTQENHEGLITRGTIAYHSQEGRETSLIYGDFFFLEALAKYRGERESFW